jgi:twitching motility protein PilU
MASMRELLEWMVRSTASDLYLTVDSPAMCRIEGELQPFNQTFLAVSDIDQFITKILTPAQRDEFVREHELNLGIAEDGLGRFRVNVFRQRNAPGIVIRRISSDIPTIDMLGLPAPVKELAVSKRGLVLVVGATGSGKSTTLAAMIDHRNATMSGHIVSIEDPIEFVHAHKKSLVTQREVGIDTASFQSALKNALRQAPDVILLGEVRDSATMEAAVSFAETGHLCLATLHSNNCSQAIERVMNFFPVERHPQIYMQLGLNLRGVVGQRLIPAVDGRRAVVCEVLLDSPRVRDLIMKGEVAEIREAMEKGSVSGMQTFDQDLYHLYDRGRISLEHALAHADSPNNLRLRISLARNGDNPAGSLDPGPALKMMQ